MLLLREGKKKVKEEKESKVEIIEDTKGSSDNGVVENNDKGFDDKKNENKKHAEMPLKALCSTQVRRPYLQLPCRGRL